MVCAEAEEAAAARRTGVENFMISFLLCLFSSLLQFTVTLNFDDDGKSRPSKS
jgi:hypothetical protein